MVIPQPSRLPPQLASVPEAIQFFHHEQSSRVVLLAPSLAKAISTWADTFKETPLIQLQGTSVEKVHQLATIVQKQADLIRLLKQENSGYQILAAKKSREIAVLSDLLQNAENLRAAQYTDLKKGQRSLQQQLDDTDGIDNSLCDAIPPGLIPKLQQDVSYAIARIESLSDDAKKGEGFAEMTDFQSFPPLPAIETGAALPPSPPQYRQEVPQGSKRPRQEKTEAERRTRKRLHFDTETELPKELTSTQKLTNWLDIDLLKSHASKPFSISSDPWVPSELCVMPGKD